ncbi:hypothetical protein BD626DRAFT_509787 [Schizophyllum amplum]|uniref:Uncharacterized protein n=1 Tax=Schizophyllum amplum TaxID=97359 RepID=A0A550C2U0_9AGAR|nr:hypothetical protein BD626DRAFT_509760 [Auriculariopsis ampla]TRM59107.1 hypothetical protein BD626DRAFT_509787 [Auriculariopsis ampla]
MWRGGSEGGGSCEARRGRGGSAYTHSPRTCARYAFAGASKSEFPRVGGVHESACNVRAGSLD